MRRRTATARITPRQCLPGTHVLPEGTALRRRVSGNPTSGQGVPLGVRLLQGATGGLVLVYLASTILRAHGTSIPFFDVGVNNLGYLGCAVLCAWRAIARRPGRWGWASLATGLLCFTTGSVLWTTLVQHFNPVPYPSISDFAFLADYPLAFLGIALLARETMPNVSKILWVDSLIAALGVAALEATLVVGPIIGTDTGNLATVVTNTAYPIGDLILFSMVAGVFAVHGWRPGRLWWILGAGLLLFATGDSIYLLRVVSGTFVPGTPLDTLWAVAALVMAAGAWQGMAGHSRKTAMTHAPNFVPVVFLLSSLGIVVYATTTTVSPALRLGVILATATLLVAIARSAYAFRQLRALADSKREARTDELTGLPNRRLFFERLSACFSHVPHRPRSLCS